MDDLDEFIEWVAEREGDDRRLVAWLKLIGSLDDRQNLTIEELH